MHHATMLLTVHYIMSLPIKSRVRDLHGVMEHFDFCIQSNFISVRMHYIQNTRGPTSQLLDPTRSLEILRPMTLRINPQKLWGYTCIWQHHTVAHRQRIFIHSDRITMAQKEMVAAPTSRTTCDCLPPALRTGTAGKRPAPGPSGAPIVTLDHCPNGCNPH